MFVLFLFSCLTIVRMGFHDFGVSGKCVLSIVFF